MTGSANGLMRFLTISAFAFLAAVLVTQARAQEADPPLDLDLPADLNNLDMEGDVSEPADFKSGAIGPRKRWQLDRGHIDSEAVTPRLRESESDTSYSGFRLRRPRKKP